MKNSKWDPNTRSIPYDKEKVAKRLRYWADQYRDRGKTSDINEALELENLAYNVEIENIHPKIGAKRAIQIANQFYLDEEIPSNY